MSHRSAVGQCLLCHNPHRSKVEHLLREAEPKLCYSCHDMSMIGLIPAHLTEQTSACTDCHYPHAGPARALLKEASSQTESEPGGDKTAGAAAQKDIGLVKVPDVEKLSTPPETEDKTAEKRRRLFEVFWEVSRLIEKGELQKAREYIEAIKDS
ncbi:MAG: cytochrome c3 family protein, partial [Planctomycetota bacterium]